MADHPMQERLEELAKRKEQALHAGSERAVERQHSKGKMTARERIEYLLDDGSFVELDQLARSRAPEVEERPYTDGVITGWGTVDGRKVCVFSQDFTVFGGSLGEVFAEKVHKVMDLASSVGVPFIGINDGAGARIQEGVVSLAMYGGIFHRNVKASGVIPQVSVILGPCAGGAVYSPAMTDFIYMVRETSHMFITGPDVVKAATGQDVSLEELGGAMTHATKSGVATFVAPDEKGCLDEVRYLLSFLPGTEREYGGIIRHVAKLLYAYCESSATRIQIVTRKAYGGAYVVMNSKSIGCDLAFAWPSAEFAVMGPREAVNIIYRREVQEAPDPEARKAELVEEYIERYVHPYDAAERGYIDDVIDPADTRRVLIESLELLRSKREELPKRKHANVPL